MNIIQFNFKQIKNRPLSSILNILLFATGVIIISIIIILRDGLEKQIEKNTADIDLVVGAKGSPLQLILSGIYHIDYPTGNIDFDEAMQLSQNPLVKQAIPLALGDNYNGFRIVGTNDAYPELYNAQLKNGSLWHDHFEVTLGAKVALKTGLTVGDKFVGVHGLAEESDHVHDANPYTVAGIFKETGTVLDQLILTNIESVWEIHEHHDHKEDDEEENHSHSHGADCDHHHEEPHNHREITTLLIQYQNPMGAINLPRLINTSTNMQAASPAQELNRLYSLLGIGVQTLTYISGLIIIMAAFSIFISLLNSLKERKYELALIRVMGGSRFRLFSILILEGLSLAFIGYIVGFIISRIIVILLSAYADANYNYSLMEWFTSSDLLLLLASLAIGIIAAIIPAVKAMNTNISKTLKQ